MSQELYDAPNSFIQNANIDKATYEAMQTAALLEPDVFWAQQAERLTWFKPWTQVFTGDFSTGEINWFTGGELNVAYNCIDRHLAQCAQKTAVIWEAENGEQKTFTYQMLYDEVCAAAAMLRSLTVKKGDRVIIYLPMIPQLMFTVLACARIGAVHSVVFAGFSAESLHLRIKDCTPKLIITADGGYRRGQQFAVKKQVDQALDAINIAHVLVVKRTGQEIFWQSGRDLWWHEQKDNVDLNLGIHAEIMSAEDPLFILYTSGSTGKPKGILHTTAGYLLGAHISFYYIMDYKPTDIYWCTADIGWITGHTYLVYGPLSHGATTLLFEGVPNYPDPGRFWQIIDKYQVSVFYSAPTVIRMLMREGDEWVKKYQRLSLRLLGTVGEPINPEAWRWYYDVIGEKRCPIVDTWWQTETGSIMISPLPSCWPQKPGSATRPFFGAKPVLLDEAGQLLTGEATGYLCLAQAWPSMLRGVYGDKTAFYQLYLSKFPHYYLTGDKARRDKEGDYWIIGRSDDVMNVAGHRIGSAEVENALVAYPLITEAAVVCVPDPIKGEAIYAFATLQKDVTPTAQSAKEACEWVAMEIGKFAQPSYIQWTNALPKTRSGKIMRRLLRKIAAGEYTDLGDISTLADPAVVELLISESKSVYKSK